MKLTAKYTSQFRKDFRLCMKRGYNMQFIIDSSFTEDKTNSMIPEVRDCAVSVNNLSFTYNNADIQVLNNLDVVIRKGESIGIVGASGCGKTTFIHILLKLVHDYTGEVSLFSKDLLDVSRQELAEKAAYVAQKPFIFSGTIKENIVYGCNRTVPEEEINEAAKNACISDSQRKASTSAREEIFLLIRRLINFINERKSTPA